MRLRRPEAAEVVRTPAGRRPRRGCGVLSGGVEADGNAVRLDVYGEALRYVVAAGPRDGRTDAMRRIRG